MSNTLHLWMLAECETNHRILIPTAQGCILVSLFQATQDQEITEPWAAIALTQNSYCIGKQTSGPTAAFVPLFM